MKLGGWLLKGFRRPKKRGGTKGKGARSTGRASRTVRAAKKFRAGRKFRPTRQSSPRHREAAAVARARRAERELARMAGSYHQLMRSQAAGPVQAEPMKVPPPSPAEAQSLSAPAANPPEAYPVKRPPAPPAEAHAAKDAALTTSMLIRPNDTFRQSIEAFLLDQRSPHTKRAYGKDLKRFVRFLHARGLEQGPEPVTRALLIAYKDSLLADGLEHTTVDRHLATLRSFFRWLVDDGHLARNPAEGVRFLNPKRMSRTIGFSDEEVRKLLKVPDLHTRIGSLHYAVLMVLFYCGLRRSEVCELRTTSLGLERGHRVLRLRGKGNAERIVVVTPAVWNAIAHYFRISGRLLTRDAPLFMPVKNNRTGVLEKPIDSSTIFYIVTRYARLGGIANRVSPHSCRATAISNARDHHVPDRAIQEFAGWASPDMITRYDKRRSSVEKSAAHAIDYGGEPERPLPFHPKD